VPQPCFPTDGGCNAFRFHPLEPVEATPCRLLLVAALVAVVACVSLATAAKSEADIYIGATNGCSSNYGQLAACGGNALRYHYQCGYVWNSYYSWSDYYGGTGELTSSAGGSITEARASGSSTTRHGRIV
jgi:hypothetical protein